jgi:hypothetical protein
MNRILLTIILIALLATLLSVGGAAGQGAEPGGEARPQEDTAIAETVNSRISYQGRLTEDGVPVTGNRNMQFYLYKDETCTQLAAFPPITKVNVPVTDGLFSVTLDVPHDSFNGQGLWLEVAVGGTTVINCQEILPVPYALGLRPGAEISDGRSKVQLNYYSMLGVKSVKSGIYAEVDGSYDVDARAVFGLASATDGTAYGVYGESNSFAGAGVYGTAPNAGIKGYASAGRGLVYGVFGRSDSTGGLGVYGYTSADSGTTYGVYGQSDSTEGRGVFGLAAATSGATYGVSGQSRSAEGRGVFGLAAATSGATYGVYGQSRSADGAGVYAINNRDTAPDLVVGGTGFGNDYDDDGRIHSDPAFSSSDLLLVSNDAVSIYLDNDGSGEDADFQVFDRDDNLIFNVDDGGTTRVQVLQITGGSDLAEPFEIAGVESVVPGMVVAIDPEHPGQLRTADRAYDQAVAGCVSGANGINPGLTMQQEGTLAEGSFPVALSGRVYCWADAAYGPLQPGDLLTSSDTPGHAMRVTDYELAQGAIIGKAMSSLTEGRGLILVLVSLQ